MKQRLLRPAEFLFGGADCVRAQRLAVRLLGILLGTPETDVRAHADERRPLALVARDANRSLDGVDVVAVLDRLHVPIECGEARLDVLGERERGRAVDGDAIVVVQIDEFAELQRPRERGRLVGHTFHEIAVGNDRVGEVIDHGCFAGNIKTRGEVRFRHRHAHPHAETLPEWTRGRFDPGGVAVFGVPRRAAVPLAKAHDLVEREVVAVQVQQRVEQHRPVAGRQNEAVAVEPGRVAGVVLEHAVPEYKGHGGGTHRHPGVA